MLSNTHIHIHILSLSLALTLTHRRLQQAFTCVDIAFCIREIFPLFSLCVFSRYAKYARLAQFCHRFSWLAAHIFYDILRFCFCFLYSTSISGGSHNWTVSQVGSEAEIWRCCLCLALPLLLHAARSFVCFSPVIKCCSKQSGKLCCTSCPPRVVATFISISSSLLLWPTKILAHKLIEALIVFGKELA